jgi:hypothetical protein
LIKIRASIKPGNPTLKAPSRDDAPLHPPRLAENFSYKLYVLASYYANNAAAHRDWLIYRKELQSH